MGRMVTVDWGNRWSDVTVSEDATGRDIKDATRVAFGGRTPDPCMLLGKNRNGSFSVVGDTDRPWQDIYQVLAIDDND